MKLNIVQRIEEFVCKYVSFSDSCYALPLALWILGTHIFESFDSFAYLVITSETKRSGKTRLAEMCTFLVRRPRHMSAITSATLFSCIEEEHPTLFCDEAEKLSAGLADDLRSILNIGYRRGQTIPRKTAGYWKDDPIAPEGKRWSTVKDYDTYCPKGFILIGDVHDTLHDRAVIIRMKRGEPKARFTFDAATTDAAAIAKDIPLALADSDWKGLWKDSAALEFLTDRDEEIWTSLFIICSELCPDRINELKQCAVDISMDKTRERVRHVNLLKAESAAVNDEYSVRLLRDVSNVMQADGGTIVTTKRHKEVFMTTAALIDGLKAIPLSPWRKFRGDGLRPENLGEMLSRFQGVKARNVRISTTHVVKGYRLSDVAAAVERIGQ